MRFKPEIGYGHRYYNGISLHSLTRGASGTCNLSALKRVLKINLKPEISASGLNAKPISGC